VSDNVEKRFETDIYIYIYIYIYISFNSFYYLDYSDSQLTAINLVYCAKLRYSWIFNT